MNPSHTEGKSAHVANTRLSGSWLIMARIVWLTLIIPSLGLFVANLVAYD